MPFVPGVSGNPAGRPPGSRNKATVLREAAFEERHLALLERLFDKAEADDVAALRLVLSRMPKLRHSARFELPPVDTLLDLPKAQAAVLAAMASGDLTAQEGAVFSRLIDVQALRLHEARDEEERLARAAANAAFRAAHEERLRRERQQGIRPAPPARTPLRPNRPPAAKKQSDTMAEPAAPGPLVATAPAIAPPVAPAVAPPPDPVPAEVAPADPMPAAQVPGLQAAAPAAPPAHGVGSLDMAPGRLPVRVAGPLLAATAPQRNLE